MIETIKLLLELGRFRFLAGGFFLYTMGSLLAVIAGSPFSWQFLLFGYAIMMPAHLSLSYSNNYFDIEVDKYNQPISIAGGSKVLIDHPELRPLCKKIALGLMLVSTILATIFIILFSYPLTYLGFIIFGNLLGWFYTAPPLRLAYRGLGEIANMINMGLLMPGIGYWTMHGSLDAVFGLFAIVFFIYGLEFMIIVETPDMEGDIKAHKSTLVTKIGRKQSYVILLFSVLLASLYFFIMGFFGFLPTTINFIPLVLLSLIPLFIAIFGWLKHPLSKTIASKVAQQNMNALISFILLINVYFVVLLIMV